MGNTIPVASPNASRNNSQADHDDHNHDPSSPSFASPVSFPARTFLLSQQQHSGGEDGGEVVLAPADMSDGGPAVVAAGASEAEEQRLEVASHARATMAGFYHDDSDDEGEDEVQHAHTCAIWLRRQQARSERGGGSGSGSGSGGTAAQQQGLQLQGRLSASTVGLRPLALPLPLPLRSLQQQHQHQHQHHAIALSSHEQEEEEETASLPRNPSVSSLGSMPQSACPSVSHKQQQQHQPHPPHPPSAASSSCSFHSASAVSATSSTAGGTGVGVGMGVKGNEGGDGFFMVVDPEQSGSSGGSGGGGHSVNSTSSSNSSRRRQPEEGSEASSRGSVSSILWSSVRGMEPQPTFFCHICLSNIEVGKRFVPCEEGQGAGQEQEQQQGGGCEHAFCRDCIKAYMQASIASRGVNIPCPMLGQNGCAYSYTPADVEATVDEAHLRKFKKFALMAQSNRYRECPNPQCGRMLKGCPCCPAMTCLDCKTRFCFFHANAHPNKSCWQYALHLRKASQSSHRTVLAIARPCPRCSAPTEKNGGCNHITCANCLHQWCWLCGATYSEGHYEVYNVLGCPGAQFSRLGDMVPFPSLLLALLVLPLRALCALLLLPFLLLLLSFLLALSLLYLPPATTLLLLRPCLPPATIQALNLPPLQPTWHFLLPLAHRAHTRRARLASDLVLGALITALLLLLTCLEVFWLPMGVLVCLVSLAAGVGSCRDAVSALFMPVFMLNALMSGRA